MCHTHVKQQTTFRAHAVSKSISGVSRKKEELNLNSVVIVFSLSVLEYLLHPELSGVVHKIVTAVEFKQGFSKGLNAYHNLRRKFFSGIVFGKK